MADRYPEECFGTICDGEIEIRLLTENHIEAAFEVLRSSFFTNESLCIATDISLPESETAKYELEQFGLLMMKEGVSLVAVHVPTNRVVGVAVNTIMYIPNEGEETSIAKFTRTKCNTPNMKCVMEFLGSIDEKFDIFKEWNIDCYFEIMFLSTALDFGRKRIGETLCKYSISLAKELYQGLRAELLKGPLEGKRPKGVASLFTSKFSQRIGSSLGFRVLHEVPYSSVSFNGKTFAEKIGPLHTCCHLQALKF